MFGHGLNFDFNYRRLVPPMLSASQRTWYSQFVDGHARDSAPPSWSFFKTAFTDRYGRTVSEERIACALQLIRINMFPNESLDSFIDRFNDLRRRAMDEVPSSTFLIDAFQCALPPAFRYQFITSKSNMGAADKCKVEKVMNAAKVLYNELHKSSVSVASAAAMIVGTGSVAGSSSASQQNDNASRGTGTGASKHATRGSGSGHGSSSSSGRVGKGRDMRKDAGQPYPSKFCSFHKVATHNTVDCHAFQKSQAEVSGSNGVAVGSPSRGNGNKDKVSKRDWVPKGHCYVCKQPGYAPGHVCDTRAVPSAGLPPRPPAHSFNMMHLPLVPQEDAVMADDTSVAASGTSYDNPNDDLDAAFTMNAQRCKFNEFSHFPSHMSHAILLPVVIENVATYAFLDSGSDFSIVHPLFFASLSAPLVPMDGDIQLGHSNSTSVRVGYTTLNIFYNKRSIHHKFEVFNFHHATNGPFIVLGRDIMPLLNIGITGLVTSWFGEVGPKIPAPIDPDDMQPNNTPVGSESERASMLATLQPLFDENIRIDAKSTYCNLEGAIVKLETKPNQVAFRKPYPIPVAYRAAVKDQLDTWLDEGVIELAQSFSGFNSPLLVVSKKDSTGTYSYKKPRVVADVRQLNSILISTDKFNIPLISDIHQRYSDADIITCIDIKSCFTSFLVDPVHKHKLAFQDPFSNVQYVFRKVCFGITFMGNMAQRVLTTLFRDLPYVSVYIDDIGVTTKGDLVYHTKCVAEVIRRLTNANLKISTEKIVLAMKSVYILGWAIIQGKLIPDPRKIANVHTWPLPQTGKDIMRYLGFCNYFRSAIPGYSTLAAPLDSLRSHKSLAGIWTDVHTRAFHNLQTALASAPVLSPVDFAYRLHVATDASNSGIGGIIYYIKNDCIHYVAMASRKLSVSELNYSTTKRELLAIVYMLTKFHKWLFGIRFTLHTDHKSLIHLSKQTTCNFMMLNWYEVIFAHSFDIVHIPGITNIISDALSRLFASTDCDNLGGGKVDKNGNKKQTSALTRSERKNNFATKDKKSLKSRGKIFAKLTPPSKNNFFAFSSFPTTTAKHVQENVIKNDDDIIDTSFNKGSTPLSYNNMTLLDCNDPACVNSTDALKSNMNPSLFMALQYVDYMTPPVDERAEIISKAHLLGHVGVNAIEKIIHNDYKLHWTNMRSDIQVIVNNCAACQAFTIGKVGYHPPRSVTADGVFDHICIDLGNFGTTSINGNNYVLVVVDYFSRYTILRALTDKSSETVAKALLSIFCNYGFPRKLTSDNGSEFVNAVMTQFVKMSGIDRRLSLPYTPTGNSVAESYVGICKRGVIKALHADGVAPEEWDLYLDAIQYSMNSQYTRLHKSRPFAVMYNRQPNSFIDYTEQVDPSIDIEKSDMDMINKKFKHIKEVVIPSIATRIKETQSADHANFIKNHKIIEHKFPINSKVMILDPTRSRKSDPRYLGPYIVQNYTKHGSYILADLTDKLLSRDVPTHHIKLLQDGDLRANEVNDATKKEFEVQAIVNHRPRAGGRPDEFEYLTNWVGYTEDDDSWEPVTSFNTLKCVNNYWARRNLANSGINRPLPDTVNKRKDSARNKHTRTFTPVQYKHSHATRSRK